MPAVVVLNTMKKPAITICDENLISRRYLCENRPKVCSSVVELPKPGEFCTFLRPYCNDNDAYLKFPNHFVVIYEDDYYSLNFTKESGFQIEENLLFCEWINVQNKSSGKSSTPCSKPVFVRGMNSVKLPGACYTLGSSIGKSGSEAETLNRNARLKMTLKWKNSDWNNLSPDPASHSNPKHRVYYIAFHNPAEVVNPFLHGIQIQDRKHVKVMVSEMDYTRLPSPYATHCHDYVKDWMENEGKGPLNREDCMNKCAIDASYIKLGCVPRDITYPHEKELCRNIPSYDDNLNAEIEECAKKCQEACFETRYLANSEIVGQRTYSEAPEVSTVERCDIADWMLLSRGVLSKDRPKPNFGNLPIFDLKGKRKCPKIKTRRNRDGIEEAVCISRVEVNFNVLKSKLITDKPKYESIELFSYIGGYLGMWLGWSLISMFDFFEILLRIAKYPFNLNRRELVMKKSRDSVQPFVGHHCYN